MSSTELFYINFMPKMVQRLIFSRSRSWVCKIAATAALRIVSDLSKPDETGAGLAVFALVSALLCCRLAARWAIGPRAGTTRGAERRAWPRTMQ